MPSWEKVRDKINVGERHIAAVKRRVLAIQCPSTLKRHCTVSTQQGRILIFSPDTDTWYGLVHMHKMPNKDIIIQLSRDQGRKAKYLHLNALIDGLDHDYKMNFMLHIAMISYAVPTYLHDCEPSKELK